MDKPSIDTLRDIAGRVVAGKGEDYIDPNAAEGDGCKYWEGGPSCIVGHILNEMGPSGEDITILIEWNEDTVIRLAEGLGWDDDNDTESSAEAMYLRIMQVIQDQGGTWGEALAEGDLFLASPELFDPETARRIA